MRRAIACIVMLVVPTASCSGPEDWGPDQLAQGHTSESVRRLQLGREVYGTYCVGCHGENGDGNGPAARFLDPKPRDFRLGKLKFASVAPGDAPRDEDYHRVLVSGLSGTAMPAFPLLSAQERSALVAYVREFAEKKRAGGSPLTVGKDPWAKDPAAGIEAGRKAYHGIAQCWTCHPAYEPWPTIVDIRKEASLPPGEMPTGLYESHIKDSEWGAPIRPPDFLQDRIKTGSAVESLVLVIGSGVGGTAMPTWTGVLEPKQLWGLAYYVRSLALLRGSEQGAELRAKLSQNPEEGK